MERLITEEQFKKVRTHMRDTYDVAPWEWDEEELIEAIYELIVSKNESLHLVRLLLPTDDEITEEMNKLPYTKHLDDGRYNDGVITGFEMGAEYVLKWCRSNKA
jgi:hypothetical protein